MNPVVVGQKTLAEMSGKDFKKYAKDLEKLLDTMVQFGDDYEEAMDPWEYYVTVVRKRVREKRAKR